MTVDKKVQNLIDSAMFTLGWLRAKNRHPNEPMRWIAQALRDLEVKSPYIDEIIEECIRGRMKE